jgi:hypothetical protein
MSWVTTPGAPPCYGKDPCGAANRPSETPKGCHRTPGIPAPHLRYRSSSQDVNESSYPFNPTSFMAVGLPGDCMLRCGMTPAEVIFRYDTFFSLRSFDTVLDCRSGRWSTRIFNCCTCLAATRVGRWQWYSWRRFSSRSRSSALLSPAAPPCFWPERWSERARSIWAGCLPARSPAPLRAMASATGSATAIAIPSSSFGRSARIRRSCRPATSTSSSTAHVASYLPVSSHLSALSCRSSRACWA